MKKNHCKKYLDYNTFIVGSDQIWSPSITHGLDSAYFGAFTAYTHKNVISYAASMGGKSLPAKYDNMTTWQIN